MIPLYSSKDKKNHRKVLRVIIINSILVASHTRSKLSVLSELGCYYQFQAIINSLVSISSFCLVLWTNLGKGHNRHTYSENMHTCKFSRRYISPTARFCFINLVILSLWCSRYSFTAFWLVSEANCCSVSFTFACIKIVLNQSHIWWGHYSRDFLYWTHK